MGSVEFRPFTPNRPRRLPVPTSRMRRSGAALLPFPTIRCCSGWHRELASVAAASTAQQAPTTPSHSNEAAALQLKRIGALRQRGGRAVVIAPAAGLSDGLQRKEWHLPLQGVPPFHARSTAQCARLVVDGIATEHECERLIRTIKTALADGLGSASQVDRSFPLLIDAAPRLLGERNHALAMALVERMQREVEQSFGSCSDCSCSACKPGGSTSPSGASENRIEQRCLQEPLRLTPSGAMLFWLSSPAQRQEQQQPVDMEVALDSYAVPHVDQVNVSNYEFSSLLYLNTVAMTERDARSTAAAAATVACPAPDVASSSNSFEGAFNGAWFAFNDEDCDRLVAPRAGRLLAFTSGFENLHQVQPIRNGNRFALSVWFRRLAPEELDGSQSARSSRATRVGWGVSTAVAAMLGVGAAAQALGWCPSG